MTAFTFVPDQPATVEIITNLNESQLGDGYVQRVPNGINYIREVWPLVFSLRTKAEVIAIRDFLKTNGIIGFTWTTPAGDAFKFMCKEYSPTFVHDGDASITARFVQVFE